MASKIRPDLFGASKDLPRIVELDVAKINPNPNQPRKFFDETSLRELAESIKSKGLLQPILVKVGQGDSYEIVAGERRWRAHKLAEIATIPAIITAGDSDEIAIIENIQRENLQPLEEAKALKRLIDTHGYSQEEAGRIVGKARTTINALLSILTLPEDILAECRNSDRITKSFLIGLASTAADKQHEAFALLKSGRAPVRTARAVKQGKQEEDTPFEKTLRAFKICTRMLEANGTELTKQEIETILQAKGELDAVVDGMRGVNNG